jgi:hypothetical protein
MSITPKSGSGFGITSSSGSCVATIPTAVNVGDFVFMTVNWAGSSLVNITPVITDNTNVGAWNVPASMHFYDPATNAIEIVGAWIVCDTAAAANTMIVTASSVGVQNPTTAGCVYSGFVYSPVLVLSDITFNAGTSTAVAATGLITSASNEIVFAAAAYAGAQNIAASTGNFSNRKNGAGYWLGDSINTFSGNALTFGQTASASVHWGVMLAGFQDVSSASAAWLS